MTDVFIRRKRMRFRGKDTVKTPREEGHETREAETGVMQL
jgi:hypothetical protein